MSTTPTTTESAANAITFRPATPADREVTLAISAHFENDWLAYAFDQSTAEGRFFVAEEAGRVIAVCGYADLGPVAWLQAMRVHPEAHNRGVATEFTLYLLDECRRKGFRTARLDTHVDNQPVHHLVGRKLGFRRRGTFFVAGAKAGIPIVTQPASTAGVREATTDDLEAAWAFLSRRAADGHLYPADLAPPVEHVWQLGDFDRDGLARRLEQGRVLLAEDAGGITGLGVWHRGVHEPDPDEAAPEGPDAPPPGPFVYGSVSYLEGDAPVQASLLQAALDRIGRPEPWSYFDLGLIESQWRSMQPLLDQGWLAGPDTIFEGVVYDKELG